MCHVQAEHITMLRYFGSFMLFAGVISYFTETSYFRGVIYKAEDPYNYWAATIGMSFLGVMTLFGLHFCA